MITAAAQLLGRRGYAAFSTNHVAQRAGVSIGTVYEYFPNKQAIVQAVLEAHIAAGEALLAARAAELAPHVTQAPLRQLVAHWVDPMLDLHADDPKLHRVLFAEVPRTRALDARVAQLEAQVSRLIEALLRAHPQTRVRSCALSAQLVVATIEALTHRWVIDAAVRSYAEGSATQRAHRYGGGLSWQLMGCARRLHCCAQDRRALSAQEH